MASEEPWSDTIGWNHHVLFRVPFVDHAGGLKSRVSSQNFNPWV